MMNLNLSENIRTFRKQRKMTQEKLAEVLGVTVGAVYKWEAGLSLPELNLIVEMADFFDTSVDVLLGYQMKDNRMKASLDRIAQYCQTMDPAALTEAEKALAKYPHSFKVVYDCGTLYLAYGSGARNQEYLHRALDLLEQSIVLLPQNDDPRINESVIQGDISTIWFLLGEREKSIDILKQNNADGIFSGAIGLYLAAYADRPEEASKYLSEAFLNGISNLLSTISGYLFVYKARKVWDSALDITSWGLELVTRLKTDTKTDFLDKALSEILAMQAYAQAQAGMSDRSCELLAQAATVAQRFDSMPNYSLKTLRFGDHMDQTAVFDILGTSASGSVSTLLDLLGDPSLTSQWKELTNHA